MEFLGKIWYLLVGIVICVFVIIVLNKKEQQDRWEAIIEYAKILNETQERGYFEGQRDALEGDIRIDQDSAGCWYWAKSPWNVDEASGYIHQPIFKPSE